MKIKIYTFAFLLLSYFCNAQKFNLSELEILTKSNFAEFSNYAIGKSYKLITSKNNYVSFGYENMSNGNMYIIEKDDSAESPVVNYVITNQNDYLQFQNELKKHNYISNDDNSSFSEDIYHSENYEFIAVVQIGKGYYKIFLHNTN
ncbi:hypothetical protein [Chryseobacterium sp. RR2-3-20]|uniref:hypothetical protein n=1 Tax=Chryseobacterium sp. RR2-3-20 TaxID=2787626 RepID=UPI001ADFD07A|nr:hypothetical protein [Chryseobacterium sp. RR2-3-20]